MIIKNMMRRKGRTLLTILGVSVGVASILGLGALAEGLEQGYGAVLNNSQADLVLSEPSAYDITLSAVDEEIGDQLSSMPEVSAVSAMVQGIVQTEGQPYFFVYGYPEGSFVLDRFQIIEGVSIYSGVAQQANGTPLILGASAAEGMKLGVGDVIRLGDVPYRIVGLYETGDAFEEGGAVVQLQDAQTLLSLPRKVSLFFIQLENPSQADRLQTRVERLYPDLSLTTSNELAGRSQTSDSLTVMVWGVSALAIVIGAVGMANAQLMAVYERTREIGVLRAIGWPRLRILFLILGESLLVVLLGGFAGLLIAWGMLQVFSDALTTYGAPRSFSPELLLQALIVVLIVGLVSGLSPALRAARMPPVEALRYDGGTSGTSNQRLPIGGMAIQNLWRRKSRTVMTLAAIGLTIGAIIFLQAMLAGMTNMMNAFAGGAEVMVQQAGAADSGFAFIDEVIGDRVEAFADVEGVSGILVTASQQEDAGIFIVQGYSPRDAAIARFNIVEGERITRNRQIMLGRAMATSLEIEVGESINVGESRFEIVGIYESGSAWEELGGIITLRDAQSMAGRARKVTWFTVDVATPERAEAVVQLINEQYPEVEATLSGDFADSLPDMEASRGMADGIAFLAIIVGGIGVMNTMLMSVNERTREIGVLRALGWKRRAVLGLIMRESLALGVVSVVVGVAIAFGLNWLVSLTGDMGAAMVDSIVFTPEVFLRGIIIALLLGAAGGLYPALRATRLEPVEALRYE